MKFRLLKVITVIMAISFAMCLLTACNNGTSQHTHDYTEQKVETAFLKSEATCTDKPVYYFSCSCGEKGTETFEFGKALGHDYSIRANGDGTHTKTCSRDDSHTLVRDCYGGTVTCTTKAVCKECSAEYGEILAHEYIQQNTDVKYLKTAVTCEEKAVYYYSCVCGKIGSETFEFGDALGHKYENYVSDGNATCTEDGTKTATCDNGCGNTDTVADTNSALGHKYTNYLSNNDMTCEQDGTKTANCDNGCGNTDTVVDTNSALGHDYSEFVFNGYNTHSKICVNDDAHIITEKCIGGEDATCLAKSVCEVCDGAYGTLADCFYNENGSCVWCNESPDYNFIPTVSNISKIDVSSKTTVEFIKNADLPTEMVWYTTEKDADGNPVLDEEGNPVQIENKLPITNNYYKGNAIKVATSNTGRDIRIEMPYTGAEYRALAQEKGFNAVKINYAISTNGSMTNSAGCLLNVVGNAKQKWSTAVLTIDEFVGTFGTCVKATETSSNAGNFQADETMNTFIVRTEAYSKGSWEVYLGNIVLTTWDFEKDVAYVGSYDLQATAQNVSTIKDTASTVDYAVEYVENSELPIEGIVNDIGYAGNALKIVQINHNITFNVTFNYTANQYLKLAEQGKFNAVKFSYMIEGENSVRNNTATNIFGVAGYGKLKKYMPKCEWVTHVISIEDFVQAFSNLDGFTAELFRSSSSGVPKFNLYLSSFEFISHDFAVE